MLKGTKIMFGEDAEMFTEIIYILRQQCEKYGFQELILPSIWEQETFIKKAGKEILGQMYDFKDKKGRDICLIPEVTAIVQEIYKSNWEKELPKPVKLFYVSRCYRYERPQAGRYREFWQFGVEILGAKPDSGDKETLLYLAQDMLKNLSIIDNSNLNDNVKRGLNYYVEDGFEVEVPVLGAQKQILGGGRYDCGIGFAIGIDRVLLAIKELKAWDIEEYNG